MKKQTDRDEIFYRRLPRRGFIRRSAGFAVGLGLGLGKVNDELAYWIISHGRVFRRGV